MCPINYLTIKFVSQNTQKNLVEPELNVGIIDCKPIDNLSESNKFISHFDIYSFNDFYLFQHTILNDIT